MSLNTPALTLLVCCHKPGPFPTQPPYLPIQVGKALAHIDLNIQGDDTGTNISLKNPSYCELTGMYWAWKNLKPQPRLIGLCHYRRYFDFHRQCRHFTAQQYFKTAEWDSLNLDVPNNLTDQITPGAALVARPHWWMCSNYTRYCRSFIPKDIKTLHNVIKERQPDYNPAFNSFMHKTNRQSQGNMFIMTWTDFNNYCTWLFDLLSETEKRIDISGYDPVQRRIYGYMAEFLLNIWLRKNKFRLIRRPLICITDDKQNELQAKVVLLNALGWLATKITAAIRRNPDQ